MPPKLEYPVDYQDEAGLTAFADRVLEIAPAYHREMERNSYGNILRYLGHQWITYDQSIKFWRPLAYKSSVPRPVTNKIALRVNTLVSNLVSYKVPITYGPGSTDPADIAAAQVADKVNQVIEKEANVRLLKHLAARWIALTGNVFIVSNYSASLENGSVNIQHERCVACGANFSPAEIEENEGACGECGESAFEPAIDSTGVPVQTQYPVGKHYTEIENIFSVFADPNVQYLHESPYVLIRRFRTKDWVNKVYGEEVAESVQYDAKTDPYSQYLDSLGTVTATASKYSSVGGEEDEPKCDVKRLWVQPTPANPAGIYAVIIGDKVVEARDFPYHDEKGKPFLNVVHIGFDQVPGRLLYKTRVDDLVPLQEQRNKFEAMIHRHMETMAGSKWLVPSGVGLTKPSGTQGEVLYYNAVPGAPPPTRLTGDTVPAYLIQRLAMIDSDMDDVFGQYEVGRGEAPKGVSAYAALQLLDERAQQGQSNLIDNWSLGWMEWSKHNLNIWREYADDERGLNLGEGIWAYEKFSKTQLSGGVDIDVELGQYRPRTNVGRRAVIEQAIRLALIPPGDPQITHNVLTVLGIPELMPDFDADKRRASQENDIWKNGQIPPMPSPLDNDMVHLTCHKQFFLSDYFEQLPPPTQQDMLGHIQFHMDKMRQRMSMMQPGPGQMAPGPAGGSKGTAKGDQAGSEEELVQQDAQNMSPDTSTGVGVQ